MDMCGDCRCNRLMKFCATDFVRVCVKCFLPSELVGLKEQRFPIDLHFDLKKRDSQTYEVLKKASCGDEMSRTQLHEW